MDYDLEDVEWWDGGDEEDKLENIALSLSDLRRRAERAYKSLTNDTKKKRTPVAPTAPLRTTTTTDAAEAAAAADFDSDPQVKQISFNIKIDPGVALEEVHRRIFSLRVEPDLFKEHVAEYAPVLEWKVTTKYRLYRTRAVRNTEQVLYELFFTIENLGDKNTGYSAGVHKITFRLRFDIDPRIAIQTQQQTQQQSGDPVVVMQSLLFTSNPTPEDRQLSRFDFKRLSFDDPRDIGFLMPVVIKSLDRVLTRFGSTPGFKSPYPLLYKQRAPTIKETNNELFLKALGFREYVRLPPRRVRDTYVYERYLRVQSPQQFVHLKGYSFIF